MSPDPTVYRPEDRPKNGKCECDCICTEPWAETVFLDSGYELHPGWVHLCRECQADNHAQGEPR